MEKCKLSGECAFYLGGLNKMPDNAGFLKQLYCHKLSHKCKRLIMSGESLVGSITNDITPLGEVRAMI